MDERFGIPGGQCRRLRALFERFPKLVRVSIDGSRGRGDQRNDSDIDLALDAPGMTGLDLARLAAGLEDSNILYRVDLVHLQSDLDDSFRRRIERDRQLFWEAKSRSKEAA